MTRERLTQHQRRIYDEEYARALARTDARRHSTFGIRLAAAVLLALAAIAGLIYYGQATTDLDYQLKKAGDLEAPI
jgi:hypothetical protein